MKKFFLASVASCFVIISTAAQEIKILTYNILHGERFDQQATTNVAEIGKLITELQPDVIALQEVDSMTARSARFNQNPIDYIHKLSQDTGYKGYFGKAMDFDGGGYGEGILVKNGSEFHTQNLPNPSGGEPRAIAWVKTEVKSLKEFYFGGTHLCHQSEENRIAQLQSIIAYADSLNQPVIWVGDLNFTPDSPEYKRVPDHWKEAGAVANDLRNTYGTAASGGRIDYIWYDSRKFELVDYEVLDQIKFSDHYPVWAVLRLIKEPKNE